ncbi:hypothetical protein TWF225_002773 [Orbilia oligospora]|uniref:Uncharacterized protein n=1 Tax=Orbilia oligospora TaxID=2813651 RepID=A0A7C8PQW5_ORBOL|nr:hypothetical protein TWF751_003949 [Orbilia oligospora]KAF3189633.1 hypothetical protein TWF225_002773 [Orbilia oligospora]KAF3238021.1 hypothetical protein TWF217_001815 [Orbilia oligospora]KAF3253756.1 hypothetical protein TWF128_006378 [Orbilia oligospora]KAF3297889.1 hypothetical protein TWF132_004038 [Orbilia oligospora]
MANALPRGPPTATTSAAAQVDPNRPPPTDVPAVDLKEYEIFYGQMRQVYVSNWDIGGDGKINPRNVTTSRKKMLEWYKVRSAMRNALFYFYQLELPERQKNAFLATLFADEPADDPLVAKADIELGYNGLHSNETKKLLCNVQGFSEFKGTDGKRPGVNLDPILYCDESGYSIRLNNPEETPRSVRCLSAAKLAYELSLHLSTPAGVQGEDAEVWIHTGKKIPTGLNRTWETIGQTFWSDRQDLFIFIAKEAPGSCKFRYDPKDHLPSFDGLPPDEQLEQVEHLWDLIEN